MDGIPSSPDKPEAENSSDPSAEPSSQAGPDQQRKDRPQISGEADATALRHTEDTLHQKERELREAQRLAQVGSWEWDPEADIVTWSEELYRLAGRDPNSPAVKYRDHAQLYTPESWRRLQVVVEAALHSGTGYEIDIEMVPRYGGNRWIKARGEAVRDANGRITKLRGTVQDITERKEAEQALRDSEERFRFAAQAGRMFAYEWNLVTDEIVRSEECAEILGLTGNVTRTTGRQTMETIHPDDRSKITAAIAGLTPEESVYRVAIRVFRPDGGLVWLERTGRGFFDAEGKLIRLIGMAVDITQRKLAEETLRESEQKFRTVFREAGVGMIIVSLEGRYLAANDTFCDFLGYTEQELSQKTIQSITHPDDWPEFSRNLNDALRLGAFKGVEKRCIHKNGSVVDTESSASVIRGPGGEPQYFVGEVMDITQRKMADAVLSTVSRRLIEVQEQERTRIARDLHDDINQRLALLAIELGQIQQTTSDLRPELRYRMGELCQQAEEIVSDVQAISRRLHSSKLEHLGIVAATKSFCEESSQQQNVEIRFSHDNISLETPYEVSLCLFRVLQEALHNAVKHSGVRQFDVRLYRTADEIGLSVSDSGIGFDPQAATSQRGLGLVSMRERLRLVGGTISIESEPHVGTTIHARVPLAEKSKGAAG
jgi:PAS domain S-box-containing protein